MFEMAVIDWKVLLLVSGLAFAPVIFWLWYFYRKDLEPEPLYVIRNCFLAGVVIVIPAAILEQLAFNGGVVILTVFVAPVVEECLKFAACYIVAYKGPNFDEPMDGVICAVAVALGFASLENVMFLYQAYQQGTDVLSITTLIRAFFTVPGHALFAVMWGYALGKAKFSDLDTARSLILKGLALGIAVHAAFNCLSIFIPAWALGMLIYIPVVWGIANRKIGESIESSPHRAKKEFGTKLEAFKKSLVGEADSGQWYQNRFAVVLLLFFLFFPVGLYALYKNTTFSKPEKVSYLVLWLLWIGIVSFRPA